MALTIPERWQEQVEKYIRETTGETQTTLSAGDFHGDQCVSLRFGDGSYAFFQYAFYLADTTLNEAAVFTEHCGYHFFPLGGLTIESLKTVQGEYN